MPKAKLLIESFKMICPECGHNNDSDAKYCQKCGFSLFKSETGISNLTKILIVFFIILVAGLAIAAGILLNANNTTQAPSLGNNTTAKINSDNSTPNNTNTNQKNVSKPKQTKSKESSGEVNFTDRMSLVNFTDKMSLVNFTDKTSF